MIYNSRCRNCECLHFFGDNPKNYPDKCYCSEAFKTHKRCMNYAPFENLEYLEWLLEKELA